MPEPLTIEFDAEKAIQAMQSAPARTARGTARALNRALTTGRADMASRLAKDMGLRARDAKEAITTEQARPDRLQVRLVASLRRRPLYDFGAKGPIPSYGKGKGVSYRIGSKGRGRVGSAFIATMPSGHTGVFRRVTTHRLKIIELFGPSIGHVFNAHRADVVEVMRAAFTARLGHELKFASTEGSNV
jgi:Prophage minor tail protein Z (GPZ).